MVKYKSHPICRIKKFIEFRESGLEVEESLLRAEKECVAEGKIHGIISMVEKAEQLGYKRTVVKKKEEKEEKKKKKE